MQKVVLLEDRQNRYAAKYEDKGRRIEEFKENEKKALIEIKKKRAKTFIQKERIMQAIM